MATQFSDDYVRVEGYFEQLPRLNSRPVGDRKVSREGGRVAECIAFSDVKLNRQGCSLKLRKKR